MSGIYRRCGIRSGTVVATLIMLFAHVGSVATAVPKVVKAEPDDKQQQVDPATRQIRIEFDQPMHTGGYSIVGGGDGFPKLVGKPRWQGDRTIIIPVKLEPEH